MRRCLLAWVGCFAVVMGCGRNPEPPTPAPQPPPANEEAVESEKPPPALTAKELASGAILLFDGESTLGWQIDGEARVEGGLLKIGGKKPTRAGTRMRTSSGNLHTQVSWSGAKEPVFKSDLGAVHMEMTPTKHSRDDVFRTVKLGGQSYFMMNREKDGTRHEDYGGNGPALQMLVDTDTELRVRDVRWSFKDLGGRVEVPKWVSLADGGAKLEKGEDGWLTVNGGPGAVASQDAFSHYLLQMECRLAGTEPKAAVQVRTPAGQPEGGHSVLLERGAGGKLALGEVEGKQKPRKEIATLGETFYLSVMVAENDVAVWVNGVPVTDWSSGAAAKGQKFERGPVLLRLLDPSTELSIRHVRLVKLIEDRIPPRKP